MVDGGLVQNVLCNRSRLWVPVVIASHLSSVDYYENPENVLDVMRNAFEIAVSQHTNGEVAMADLIIAMNLSDFSLRDNTERFDELFSISYDTATKQLNKFAWLGKKESVLLFMANYSQSAHLKYPI